MKTLLWKECRENLYKVLLGLAACLAVHFLRMNERFNAEFSNDSDEWAWGFGLVAAVVFGMEMIAGEKSRGTMDFLMARPLAPVRMLAVKFVVGATGLLVVMTGFWAMVYATSYGPVLDGAPHLPSTATKIMEDVGLPAMVQIWFLPTLIAYTMVFLGSAFTSDPVKAIASGALVLYAVGLLALLIVNVDSAAAPWFVQLTEGLEFDGSGGLVRIADDGWIRIRSVWITMIVCGGLLAAALLKITRFREYTLQWRPILAVAAVAVAVPIATSAYLNEYPEVRPTTTPYGTLAVGKATKDLLVVGRSAFVLKKDDFLTIDISRADSMFERGSVPLNGWPGRELVPAGRFVAIAGGRRMDSLGVAVVDADMSTAPRVLYTANVWPYTQEVRDYSFESIGEHTALLRVFEPEGTWLVSLRIDGEGAEILDELHVDREPGWVSSSGRVYEGKNVRYHIHPNGGMGIDGHHVFLGMRNGLAILDVQDPRDLRLLSTYQLEAPDRRSGSLRNVVVKGDSVVVTRQWPKEEVVLDVSDREHPAILGWLGRYTIYNRAKWVGENLVTWGYRGVELYDRVDPGDTPSQVIQLKRNYASPIELAISDGTVFILRNKELQAFRLETGALHQ